MTYALYVAGFLATAIGVVGHTWSDDRPTVYGWIAIILALIVLVLLVAQNLNRDKEQRMLASIACDQVLRGTFGVVEPFAILLASADLEKKESGTGSTKLNQRIFRYLRLDEETLSSHAMSIFDDLPELLDHSDSLEEYTLRSYVPVLNGNRRTTWQSVFETTAQKGIEELDDTLSAYRSVMTVDLIKATQRLRNVWLTQRIENLNAVDAAMSLAEFLQLNEKRNEQTTLTIFEEFYEAARKATALCSEKKTASMLGSSSRGAGSS